MKFKTKRELLLKALSKVCNIIGNKTTLPILANVLLEAENGRLFLTATDLEIRINTSIEADVEIAGKTTLPAKRLLGLVSKFKGAEVEFDTNDKFHTVINCGTANFMIMGLDPEDFPAATEFTAQRSIKLKQTELSRMIDYISYAASLDDSRKVLQGILLSVKEGNFTAVATDGKRLALVEKVLENPSEGADGDIIVTLKAASELKRIMEKEGEVTIEIDEKQVAFKADVTTLHSKLIEGNYPNYKQVIPPGFAKQIEVPCSSFIDALEIVSIPLSDVSSSFVKLTFSAGQLLFESNSTIGEGKEYIQIPYEDSEISLSFNPQLLADPFKHVNVDKVNIKINEGFNPIAIETTDGFLYVIMPIRNK
ncbi:MAG: DNA polymerase III subunit beta [Lentisphaeria bacterium]|nr:DNA polymerase III subunit beta [Lentisphaeria bacterium]